MAVKHHLNPSLGPRFMVKILTVDPATRKIEAILKDSGLIQIAVFDTPQVFVWPRVGEYWTARKDNGIWMLDKRVNAQDSHTINDLNPGDAKIHSNSITDLSGKKMISVDDKEISGGEVITYENGEWIAKPATEITPISFTSPMVNLGTDLNPNIGILIGENGVAGYNRTEIELNKKLNITVAAATYVRLDDERLADERNPKPESVTNAKIISTGIGPAKINGIKSDAVLSNNNIDFNNKAIDVAAISTGLTTAGNTLAIDTNVVPRLSVNNSFTGNQSIAGMLSVTQAASSHTLQATLNATSGSNITALNVVSNNPDSSSVWISGKEKAHGTLKVAHVQPSSGSDADAAAISINLASDPTRVSGGDYTAAQGIYMDTYQVADGGTGPKYPTSGTLLNLKNAGDQKLVLNANGQLQLPKTTSSGGIVIGGDTQIWRAAADVLRTDDYVYLGKTSGVNLFTATTSGSGSSVANFALNADGKLEWGSGGVSRDTNLYRNAANELKTDGKFIVGNGIQITGDALISGNISASNLGTAAFRNVGTDSDQVSAGNHTHTTFSGSPTALTVTGNIVFGGSGYKLTNVATPTDSGDAVNKSYVDGISTGLNVKAEVNVATTGSGETYTISGSGTSGSPYLVTSLTGDATNPKIDGVTVTSSSPASRILIKNATQTAANGIYYVTSTSGNTINVSRATDMTTWATPLETAVKNAYTFVLSGTQGNSGFIFNGSATGTIGVDPITFAKFTTTTGYTAGSGLTLSGTEFSIPNSGVTNAMLAGNIGNNKTTATHVNTASAIVARDVNGDFESRYIKLKAIGANSSVEIKFTDPQGSINRTITIPSLSGDASFVTTVDSGTISKGMLDSNLSPGLDSGNDNLITRVGSQTLSNKTLVSPKITTDVDSNSASFTAFATPTSLTVGSGATTGNYGYAGTAPSTTNISTGNVANNNTKNINIGTNSQAGSITNIIIGSSAGTAKTVINGSGSTSLEVNGTAKFNNTIQTNLSGQTNRYLQADINGNIIATAGAVVYSYKRLTNNDLTGSVYAVTSDDYTINWVGTQSTVNIQLQTAIAASNGRALNIKNSTTGTVNILAATGATGTSSWTGSVSSITVTNVTGTISIGLYVSGSNIAANTTVTSAVNTSGTTWTIGLSAPTVATQSSTTLTFPSQTIDGLTTFSLNYRYQSVTLQADTTNPGSWFVL